MSVSPAPQPPIVHSARHIARDWRLFSAATFLFNFGFSMYGAVFINFITGILKVGPIHMGMLESQREIPGLLSVAIAASVARFAEGRIGALCLIFSALGVAATGFVHSFTALVMVTVFWSIFMHQWLTSSSAIPLALAEEQGQGQEGGRHLGRMGKIGAAGTVLAFLVVLPLAGHVSYRFFFVSAAAFILLGGLCLLPLSEASTTPNRLRLLFRREYGLYYGLTFLEGCRRQIFSTFALFALIEQWDVSLEQITTLMLINAVLSFFVAAPIGKLIDRIGERKAMTFYYIAIALTFAGYATVPKVLVLAGYATMPGVLVLKGLWIMDSVLFALGISITTYLNRIVRPGELMPSLSMGQTMNHVAAVAIPVTGGLLWHRFGYHAPFWCGVAAALVSLLLTQAVTRHHRPALATAS